MGVFEIYPLDTDDLCRAMGIARYLSQKERDAIPEEDFAGPHHSFPVRNQQDVDNDARLLGHAKEEDQPEIKRNIIRLAKKKGLKLPKSWEEEEEKQGEKERSMGNNTHIRAVANHEPMSGTHTHSHPAFGAQGDDESHEHEHTHNNDADHKHAHSEDRVHDAPAAIQTSDRHTMSLPLVRIDASKREVWGQATAEVPDSYGTIFGYYPDAWKSWRGNIREQHDPKKAVGKRIDLECDDLGRSIGVGSRVSRGAQDTWLKVEDNVLTGYSASIIPDPEFGNDPKRWPKKEYNGKMYPYLPRYTVAELSLVDNPACPGCNIQIVRADGFATDVLDLEDATAPTESSSPLFSRAGARVSSDTRAAMHQGVGHTLKAAVSQMKNCGCEDCQAAMKMIDPDGDGDIDMGGYDDPDNDWQSLYGNGSSADTERMLSALIERVLEAKLVPVYQRFQGIAGTLSRSNVAPMESLIDSAITRAVEAAHAAHESRLSEVRAEVSAVKATVEKIADTPVPGAPIMNVGAMPRPALPKQLSTDSARDPYALPKSTGSAVADAMRHLTQAGYLNTFDSQMEALSAGLALQKQQSGR